MSNVEPKTPQISAPPPPEPSAPIAPHLAATLPQRGDVDPRLVATLDARDAPEDPNTAPTMDGGFPSLRDTSDLQTVDRANYSVKGELAQGGIGRILRARDLRVRALQDPDERAPYAISNRPYPGAGGCYELEVYLAVGACDGLDPGLYHYDPLGHALAMTPGPLRAASLLLDDACAAMHAPRGSIPTLVVLAARFERMLWKYESIGYAAILKDVGALYQTMYLVATAMGLGPCALGGGDSDLFAEAAGLDYYSETSVGELVLGARSAG